LWRPVALTKDPHALVLLGEVYQMEVCGKGPGDLVGALDGEAFDDLCGARKSLGCLIRVRLDCRESQLLDIVEQSVGSAFAQHSAEQIPEQPNVGPHSARDAMFCLESSDQINRGGGSRVVHGATLAG
jgi:hypothetical protein